MAGGIGSKKKQKVKKFFFGDENIYLGKKLAKSLGYSTETDFYKALIKRQKATEVLDEADQRSDVEAFRKEVEDVKRKKRRENRKRNERFREFLNLNDFKAGLHDLPDHPKPKYKPTKQRQSKTLVSSRMGDTRIKYTFQTTLNSDLGDDEEKVIKHFFADVETAFQLPSIQKLLRMEGVYVGLVAYLTSSNTDSRTTNHVSSTFNPSKEDTIRDMQWKVRGHCDHYTEDIVEVREFDIIFVFTSANQGAGSSTKTIQCADKTWKVCDVDTRTNCLYVAVTMAVNYEKFRDFATNKKTKERVLNTAKQLKKHLKEKGCSIRRLFSTQEEIEMCAEHLKTRIKVYNNIFRVIQDYTPKATVCRKTKQKNTIEIQVSDNHYKALLRRSTINEPFVEEVIEEGVKINEMEDKLITKKIFQTPQTFKYGAYDIEATPEVADHNYHKAYACGLTYFHDNDFVHKQWWGMDCQTQFVDYLFNNMNVLDGHTLYAHNGGKYDYPNLVREALLKHKGLHIRNLIELNGRLMSFYLTDGNHKLHFRDSSCIFVGQSLDSITKALDVKHKKLTELVKHEDITLDNYMLHRPSISKYLEHDCTGLLECILSFANSVYEATQINLSQVYTGATLAKKHFYKNHYYDKYTRKPKYDIYFLSKEKDRFIRSGYFGGRTEAFRMNKIQGKVYYDDFTSLYPSMAHSNRLPYGSPEWVDFKNNDDFKGFFGFCDVWVRSINLNKKPIHATNQRVDGASRRLFAHYLDWTKMNLFSQEIRLGREKGVYEYKFEGCRGISFNSGKFLTNVFQECFEQKQKNNDNEAMRMTWKIIANSLYGFWGLRWTDRDSILIEKSSECNLAKHLASRKVTNISQMGEYTTLKVSKDLEMEDFNVAIASAITSYSRMKLWNLINDIEDRGYEVYYCDTDSVISNCNIREDDYLQATYCPDITGDALGSLKNECLDKIKKHNKKTDNKIDINLQSEADGGELCFDEVIICGCKWYALKKTCYNGEVIMDTKLKGYKEGSKDSKDYQPLLYEDYERVTSDKSQCIFQVQQQFNIPKSSYIDEERRFGLKIIHIPKKFHVNYKKGKVDAEGKIHPFVL